MDFETYANSTEGKNLADTIPQPDHIIFVWFENKGYSQIVNSASAPFINSLINQGTLFTNTHALGHPSYPEYIRWFAGTRNGITSDDCISGKPFKIPNMFTRLKERGKTFAWYSEDLPYQGSDICSSGAYREKHNPTTIFSNVDASANKSFSDFPKDYNMLENVVCISPNLNNDMHDGSILQGDRWLKSNLENLINWCKTHNSVFVAYFDETNEKSESQIPVIAVGQEVKQNYRSKLYYDHYNWTKTVLNMYGAAPMAGAVSRSSIADCWK